jgi:hypothetical protein
MTTILQCPHCHQKTACPYKPSLAGTVRCAHADCQKPFYVFAAEDIEIEDAGKRWICADAEIADAPDWSKVETTIAMVSDYDKMMDAILNDPDAHRPHNYIPEALRNKLELAEKQERYEVCAELRDQIKELKNAEKTP